MEQLLIPLIQVLGFGGVLAWLTARMVSKTIPEIVAGRNAEAKEAREHEKEQRQLDREEIAKERDYDSSERAKERDYHSRDIAELTSAVNQIADKLIVKPMDKP